MGKLETARAEIAGATVAAVRADITGLEVDAVVNAANPQLQHGGGLAAAIRKAGGQTIQEESDAWVREHGPLGEGVAAVTTAGGMPARWVVHTAGPVYDSHSDRNEPLLRSAVRAALEAARGQGARSLALPIISAGVYGYPRDEAAAVIASEVVAYLREHEGAFDSVRLVGYDEAGAADLRAGLGAAVGAGEGDA